MGVDVCQTIAVHGEAEEVDAFLTAARGKLLVGDEKPFFPAEPGDGWWRPNEGLLVVHCWNRNADDVAWAVERSRELPGLLITMSVTVQYEESWDHVISAGKATTVRKGERVDAELADGEWDVHWEHEVLFESPPLQVDAAPPAASVEHQAEWERLEGLSPEAKHYLHAMLTESLGRVA